MKLLQNIQSSAAYDPQWRIRYQYLVNNFNIEDQLQRVSNFKGQQLAFPYLNPQNPAADTQFIINDQNPLILKLVTDPVFEIRRMTFDVIRQAVENAVGQTFPLQWTNYENLDIRKYAKMLVQKTHRSSAGQEQLALAQSLIDGIAKLSRLLLFSTEEYMWQMCVNLGLLAIVAAQSCGLDRAVAEQTSALCAWA